MPEEITRLVSRGLTKINSKGNYEVDIADKVTIRNEGKIYDIKLKKNVYWQNGKQFTTKDINYNFKNVNFVAKNDFEGYFILKEKYAPFLQLLSIPITDDKLNGVGDYKVARIEFDGDFIKAVYLTGPEKFTYRFYPSQKIAITAFKLGEVNILKYLNSFENVKIWKKSRS